MSNVRSHQVGIEVATVTEEHTVIREVNDTAGVVAQLASTRWPSLQSSVCLRFVEPWGDTVFNQTQIPKLLAELRAEVAAATEQSAREHLRAIVHLVETAVDQVHTYVKFIGD
jgi:hypothetical protein